jgi:hypothetical protein
MQALSKDLFLFILPQPLTSGALSVILYPMREMKETYKTNPALVDHIKGLQAYQKIKQEREEDLKRDREIMFEAAFPALIAGTVIGLIMGELLLRI